jgi:hypothetical protein
MVINVPTAKVPPRMAKLPHYEGVPIPWYVQWLDENGGHAKPGEGIHDLDAVDGVKYTRCCAVPRCWLCGERRSRQGVFFLTAANVIGRVGAEPPSHNDCAEYAAQTYLAPDGVICLWQSSRFLPFHSGRGILFRLIGDADHADWWTEGRRASHEEAHASMASHYALLLQAAREEGWREVRQLHWQYTKAIKFLPEEEEHDLSRLQAGA